MIFQKKFFIFLFYIAFGFVLFFPESSLAASVSCHTECGEEVTCGRTSRRKCSTCCDEDSCWSCCPCCTQYRCSGSWTVYRASTEGCEPIIEKGRCWSVCSGPGARCCSCGGCELQCGEWETCEECGSWQKAERTCGVTGIGLDKPECKCRGACIETPSGFRYYNNPNYPIDPCNREPGVGSANIKLPVKLDWDDVEGWKDGWCSSGGYELADACGNMRTSASVSPYKQCCKAKEQTCIEARSAEINWGELTACEKRVTLAMIRDDCIWTQYQVECLHEVWEGTPVGPEPSTSTAGCVTGDCPFPDLRYDPSEMVQYYEIKIEGEMRGSDGSAGPDPFIGTPLKESEFIPPHPCFFKSDRSYTWRVRACCGGGECSDWSTPITFTTSLAPELVWPYDPDWVGPDWAEPNWTNPTYEEFPVELSWCEVDEANSYFIQTYKEGDEYCPELLCPIVIDPDTITFPQDPDSPAVSVYFDLDSFTKGVFYEWKMATCLNEDGTNCGGFGQRWGFLGTTTLAKVELILPEDEGCANLSSRLEWQHVAGARSYLYTINEVPALQNILTTSTIISFEDIWSYLDLNATYTWQVEACWDENGLNCEEASRSDEWEFITTGAVPTGLDPPDGEVGVVIPIKLNWDDMPCAASYKYEVAGGGTTTEGLLIGSSELSISYESGHPTQNTSYSWKVWTCADAEGTICGNPASGNFTTFELAAPTGPHPSNNGEFYTNEYYLKWESVLGGAFYQYEILGEIGPNIVPSNSAFIDTAALGLGTYTWTVRACIDQNCDEPSPNISTWSFELVEGEAPAGKGGIVPCGKYTDNPDTPHWNERDRCGIQHIFIMIFLIVEFLLWKVIPVVLALLVLASGVMFYFSGQLGISAPIIQVKSLWKAAGLGLAIIFLAWTGISLILGLFGYQVGLFGPWWKISF